MSTEPPCIVVEVDSVSKAYRRGNTSTPVLDNVNLSVQQGECVFLLGPSGSGKSTLLSIIGCVLSPDSGKLSILGRQVQQSTRQQLSELRRHHLGFIFQRFHLIRGLTAFENVCIPMLLDGPLSREQRRRAEELLASVGLADKQNSPPTELSVGQCQRIALARALANDPDLILADEPTASLDAENGQEAVEMLRRLAKERQKTVIVVTHDRRILSYADRVLELDHGRLIRDTTNDVALDSNLQEMMS